jgi:hypothetical protein
MDSRFAVPSDLLLTCTRPIKWPLALHTHVLLRSTDRYTLGMILPTPLLEWRPKHMALSSPLKSTGLSRRKMQSTNRQTARLSLIKERFSHASGGRPFWMWTAGWESLIEDNNIPSFGSKVSARPTFRQMSPYLRNLWSRPQVHTSWKYCRHLRRSLCLDQYAWNDSSSFVTIALALLTHCLEELYQGRKLQIIHSYALMRD